MPLSLKELEQLKNDLESNTRESKRNTREVGDEVQARTPKHRTRRAPESSVLPGALGREYYNG